VYVKPDPQENIPVHLQSHQAERIRWNGLEAIDDPRAKNIPLLDQHMAETEQNRKNQGVAVSISSMSGNETPGEEVGNQAAGQMGAMMGEQNAVAAGAAMPGE
jgi:hypothetical protein